MSIDPSLSIRVASYNIGNKDEYKGVIQRGYQLGRGVDPGVHQAFNRVIQSQESSTSSRVNLAERINRKSFTLKHLFKFDYFAQNIDALSKGQKNDFISVANLLVCETHVPETILTLEEVTQFKEILSKVLKNPSIATAEEITQFKALADRFLTNNMPSGVNIYENKQIIKLALSQGASDEQKDALNALEEMKIVSDVTKQEKGDYDTIIENQYNTCVEETINKIRDGNLDVINLQEAEKAKDHGEFFTRLEGLGYKIARENKEESEYAIAYKPDKFTPVGDGKTTLIKDAKDQIVGAYIDLKDNKTGIICRSVTSHLSGLGLSDIREFHNKKTAGDQSAVESKKGMRDLGRSQLKVVLDATTPKVKRTWMEYFGFVKRPEIVKRSDLVIHGSDTNRSPKFYMQDGQQTKLPKDQRYDANTTAQFQGHGYQPEDTIEATVIDLKSPIKYKGDQLVVKGEGIKSLAQKIEGLNDSILLSQAGKTMSDHIPVISDISMTISKKQTFSQRIWDRIFNPPPEDLKDRQKIAMDVTGLNSVFKKKIARVGYIF